MLLIATMARGRQDSLWKTLRWEHTEQSSQGPLLWLVVHKEEPSHPGGSDVEPYEHALAGQHRGSHSED